MSATSNTASVLCGGRYDGREILTPEGKTITVPVQIWEVFEPPYLSKYERTDDIDSQGRLIWRHQG